MISAPMLTYTLCHFPYGLFRQSLNGTGTRKKYYANIFTPTVRVVTSDIEITIHRDQVRCKNGLIVICPVHIPGAM